VNAALAISAPGHIPRVSMELTQNTYRASPRALATPAVGSVQRLSPYLLTALRIVAALLFLEHGLSRLFGFPSPLPTPHMFTLLWFAGAIELLGGVLLLAGLFTRPVALLMS